MKTEWDYTDLAAAYVKRPDYSDQAILVRPDSYIEALAPLEYVSSLLGPISV